MNSAIRRRIACWRKLRRGRGSDTIRLYGIASSGEIQPEDADLPNAGGGRRKLRTVKKYQKQ
jgi:hypothetical protein